MIRNLSRRALRAREEARHIVTRSPVPLTRAERERLEIAAYWRMRFDERSAKAHAVVKRWTKIAELRQASEIALRNVREALDVAMRRPELKLSQAIVVLFGAAEAAIEEAESFIQHEGVADLLGAANVWSPRAELRDLAARIDAG